MKQNRSKQPTVHVKSQQIYHFLFEHLAFFEAISYNAKNILIRNMTKSGRHRKCFFFQLCSPMLCQRVGFDYISFLAMLQFSLMGVRSSPHSLCPLPYISNSDQVNYNPQTQSYHGSHHILGLVSRRSKDSYQLTTYQHNSLP